MRELLIVLQREFTVRVRSRSFILSTILTPLFLGLIFFGPMLAQELGGGKSRTVAIVDESPTRIGERLASQIASDEELSTHLASPYLGVPRSTVRDSLNRRILGGDLDGYVVIPADVLTGGEVEYFARNLNDRTVQRQLRQSLEVVVQTERIRELGVDPQRLARVLSPVALQTQRIDGSGGDADSSLLISMMAGFLLYFLILIYGTQVMQSVQEEKQNRISEILVSSLRAPQLMLGKILGVGSVALLQVGIWAALGVAVAHERERWAGSGSEVLELANRVIRNVQPTMLVAVVGFLLLGFFLYAAIYAAIGAAAASTEDAQRFTIPVILPLIVPILLSNTIISAPQDTLAQVLSWIPFTLPLVMPMRMGAEGVSGAAVAASLVYLALSVVALGVVAGKIYRIGILSTGKRPSLRDLGRWIRTA